MRNRFDQQLELLNKQLIYMGELCEEAIGKATTALKEGSMEQAEKVRIADEEIDQAETDIERLCLRLLIQILMWIMNRRKLKTSVLIC